MLWSCVPSPPCSFAVEGGPSPPSNHQPATPITKLFADAYAPFFGSAPPPYPLYIWDTTALAYLVDPTFATATRDLWVDMNTTFDANYGKSIVYDTNPKPAIPLLTQSKVVLAFDTARFYAFYADLLTRPVPVHLNHGHAH